MTEAPQAQHVSHSQLNTLRTCGEMYRLERVEKVPSRPSAAAIAGQAIHKGTEEVDFLYLTDVFNPHDLAVAGIKSAEDDLAKRLETLEAAGWPEHSFRSFGRPTQAKPGGEDMAWFREHGIPQAVRAYVDWRLKWRGTLELAIIPEFGPAVEFPFDYDLDGRVIRGIIDRVFTSPEHGGYYPLDIKTGSKPKTLEQLGLYSDALRQLFGWQVDYAYYIWGLKTGEASMTAPLQVGHWTTDTLAGTYRPVIESIDRQLFIPHPGDACRICSVIDHCQFAQALV